MPAQGAPSLALTQRGHTGQGCGAPPGARGVAALAIAGSSDFHLAGQGIEQEFKGTKRKADTGHDQAPAKDGQRKDDQFPRRAWSWYVSRSTIPYALTLLIFRKRQRERERAKKRKAELRAEYEKYGYGGRAPSPFSPQVRRS